MVELASKAAEFFRRMLSWRSSRPHRRTNTAGNGPDGQNDNRTFYVQALKPLRVVGVTRATDAIIVELEDGTTHRCSIAWGEQYLRRAFPVWPVADPERKAPDA
jgi:hypothetical protein